MAYFVRTEDLYRDVYEKICGYIKDDPALKELTGEVYFDFDLVSTPTPPKTPRDVPRIYLLPVSVNFPIETSCNGSLDIEYNVVIDGFHFRDLRLAKIAWRMIFLLRYFPFTCIDIDGRTCPVVCTVGSGTYDFDADRQIMTHSIGLSVSVKV